MPPTQKPEPRENKEQQRDQLHARIGERVLAALGKPSGLNQMQVRALWAENYRVNAIVKDDSGAFQIRHSFFLRADQDGNIIEATPPITRQY